MLIPCYFDLVYNIPCYYYLITQDQVITGKSKEKATI